MVTMAPSGMTVTTEALVLGAERRLSAPSMTVAYSRSDLRLLEFQGIGMIRDFLAFAPGQKIGDGVYMLHALYNVAVFDGRTLELLAVQTAKSETLYQNRFRGNPAVFVDNSYWAESYDKLNDAKRDKIVTEIKQMIDDTLPATLQELDLLP